MMSPLLLDTHTWIWLVLGESLAAEDVSYLQQASQQARLRLSAISVWELGMLIAKGRLECHLSPQEWTSRALALPGLELLPLSPEIALKSSFLPGAFHGDPADRLIVATALHYQAELLTRDTRILNYAHTNSLQVRKI